MRSVRLAVRMASPPCVWNQIFTPAKTTATTKNGAVRRKSCPSTPSPLPPNDQQQHQGQNGHGAFAEHRQNESQQAEPIPPSCRPRFSARKNHKIDSRKNTIANVFLRWAIQATDSTFTGWTANNSAARYAPGIESFDKIAHNNNAATKCSTMFTT